MSFVGVRIRSLLNQLHQDSQSRKLGSNTHISSSPSLSFTHQPTLTLVEEHKSRGGCRFCYRRAYDCQIGERFSGLSSFFGGGGGSFPLLVIFVFGYLFEDLICKNLSINDKWSFVPLSVVFIFGYLFEDSICKNQSECCVDVKICP